MADEDAKYSAAAHTQAAVDVADFPEDPNEEVVKEQAKVVGVTAHFFLMGTAALYRVCSTGLR